MDCTTRLCRDGRALTGACAKGPARRGDARPAAPLEGSARQYRAGGAAVRGQLARGVAAMDRADRMLEIGQRFAREYRAAIFGLDQAEIECLADRWQRITPAARAA